MIKSLQLPKELLKKETVVTIGTLSIALIAVSFAPIFIKLSESEISPNATAFNRLWIATLALGLWNAIRYISIKLKPKNEPTKTSIDTPRTLGFLLISGVSYVAFQCTWAWSLTQTSIAISTLIHNLTPVFMSLGTWFVFRQQFDQKFLIGMVLAVGGTTAIGLEDWQITPGEIQGDLAALISAILYGVYLLGIGQLRSSLSATVILMWSSLIGTSVILPILLITQDKLFPSSLQGWLPVIALAIICQVIGQGFVVYSLDKLSVNFVALFFLLDPALTAIEAWVIFSEKLSILSCLAFCISLFGIYLTLSSQAIYKQA